MQDCVNCIADFSLLDPVAAPTILFRLLDFSIKSYRELLIFTKIVVERAWLAYSANSDRLPC